MALIRRRDQGGERALATRAREWDPFEAMREFMQMEPFRELARLTAPELAFAPSLDVKETGDSIVVKADLPGVKEEELDVSLTGHRLVISGKREEETRRENETYYAFERSYGTFSRALTLPEGVDLDRVNADLRDGVLTLTIPKKPEIQPKKIEVLKGRKEGQAKA